jgi:hypothetical protein
VINLDRVIIVIDLINDPEPPPSQGIVTRKLLFQRLSEERVFFEPFNGPLDDRLHLRVKDSLKVFYDLPPWEFLWSLQVTPDPDVNETI